MSDDFRIIKERINLADYVGRFAPLKRAGNAMKCLCPLPGHAEKTPSFEVKGDHWTCWGKCGKSGDIFDFYQAMYGGTRQDALIELARECGHTLEPLTPAHKEKQDKRERLYALMEEATQFFERALEINDAPMNYLMQKRGLSIQTIKAARMGWARDFTYLTPKLLTMGYAAQELLAAGLSKQDKTSENLYDAFRNRIVVPIRDEKGRIVAFSGRAMSSEQQPKYLHNATTDIFEKSKIVHRMPQNRATTAIEAFSTLVIVEGTIDPVSALNCDIFNVVSIMGKSLTDDQLALLCKQGTERLVFCLDRDEAGRKALRSLVEKHAANAAAKGVSLYAMFSPHGKDPDDCFREMPHLWQPAVDAARPAVDVLIDLEMQALGAGATAVQKTTMARGLIGVLKSDNPMIQQENIGKLAAAVGIDPKDMTQWFNPQMSVIKGHVKAISESYPVLELEVLHGILVNTDQWWLDRANAVLDTMGHYPYALQALSQNDFNHPEARDLMARINHIRISSPDDFDMALRDDVGMGPLYNVYWRATCKPEIIPTFATDITLSLTLEYSTFIKRVMLLRQIRLMMDLKHGIPDRNHEMEAIVVKNMLSRKQKGM